MSVIYSLFICKYFYPFFQIYLFVINEPEDFHTCFKRFNVDGVMTDYPTKLTKYLKEQITDSTPSEEETPIAKTD